MTDAELIRAVQAGDPRALSALYRTYLDTVWRFVWWRARGDRHAAEDIVSETFLAAVDSIGTLQPEGGTLASWLLGIASNKVVDHRRRQMRDRRRQAAAVELAAVRHGVNVLSGDAERRRPVAEAMEALADDEQLALQWKYVDGLPVRDVAARLGRTAKATEALLYRARQSFREALDRAERRARQPSGE